MLHPSEMAFLRSKMHLCEVFCFSLMNTFCLSPFFTSPCPWAPWVHQMLFVSSQNLLSANDSDYHAGLALFNPTTWNNDAARFFSKSEPTRELQREIGAKQGFPWFKFIIDPTSDHDSDSMVSICSFHHPGQWQKNTVSYPGRKLSRTPAKEHLPNNCFLFW